MIDNLNDIVYNVRCLEFIEILCLINGSSSSSLIYTLVVFGLFSRNASSANSKNG